MVDSGIMYFSAISNLSLILKINIRRKLTTQHTLQISTTANQRKNNKFCKHFIILYIEIYIETAELK